MSPSAPSISQGMHDALVPILRRAMNLPMGAAARPMPRKFGQIITAFEGGSQGGHDMANFGATLMGENDRFAVPRSLPAKDTISVRNRSDAPQFVQR